MSICSPCCGEPATHQVLTIVGGDPRTTQPLCWAHADVTASAWQRLPPSITGATHTQTLPLTMPLEATA